MVSMALANQKPWNAVYDSAVLPGWELRKGNAHHGFKGLSDVVPYGLAAC